MIAYWFLNLFKIYNPLVALLASEDSDCWLFADVFTSYVQIMVWSRLWIPGQRLRTTLCTANQCIYSRSRRARTTDLPLVWSYGRLSWMRAALESGFDFVSIVPRWAQIIFSLISDFWFRLSERHEAYDNQRSWIHTWRWNVVVLQILGGQPCHPSVP